MGERCRPREAQQHKQPQKDQEIHKRVTSSRRAAGKGRCGPWVPDAGRVAVSSGQGWGCGACQEEGPGREERRSVGDGSRVLQPDTRRQGRTGDRGWPASDSPGPCSLLRPPHPPALGGHQHHCLGLSSGCGFMEPLISRGSQASRTPLV